MLNRLLKNRRRKVKENRCMLTEDEAWTIWAKCGKLAGVDYYEYAVKIIQAYEQKNKNDA